MALDAEGFFHPRMFGFDVPDGYMKMRVFPLQEKNLVYSGDASTADLFQIMGIGNAAHIFGDNFVHMPGIIWSVSLGSPPMTGFEDLMEDWRRVREGFPNDNIEGWFAKYFSNICFNVAATVYFYNPYFLNWGGVNLFLDITENTLLDKEANVINVLNIVRGKAMSFSVLENPEKFQELQQMYLETLDWVKSKVAPYTKLKIWKIMAIFIYALFRRIKHSNIPDWKNETPLSSDFHNYNLRIYLIKRRGRFLHDATERGPGRVPLGEFPPVDGKLLNCPKMWLAVAQYYRIMSAFQSKFSLDAGEGVGILTMMPIHRFILRDAHACTSSSLSARYDSQFFDSAASAANTFGGQRNRTVMLGVNPEYKLKRHAQLYTLNDSWVNPPTEWTRHSRLSCGVLAGVCWFYNHTNEPMINYPILKLPFDELTYSGIFGEYIPTLVKDQDIRNVSEQMPHFWAYGVDEYILSEFLSEQVHYPDRWDELNLLFFTIHWWHIHRSPDYNIEYYPIMQYILHRYVGFFHAAEGVNTLDNFIKFLHSSSPEVSKIYFNLMYGNEGSLDAIYRYRSDAIVGPSDERIQSISTLFRSRIFKNMDGSNPISSLLCILDNCHRYDRPFYWNSTAPNTYSPRLKPDGNYIVPTNRDNIECLQFAINYKLARDCVSGPCVPDDTEPISRICKPYIADRRGIVVGGKLTAKGRTHKRKLFRNKRYTRRS